MNSPLSKQCRLIRRLGRASNETARHPVRNAAESKRFEIGVVLGFEGVVGDEGPFAGEVDGGRGYGPSLVIRSPLRRLVWVRWRRWSNWRGDSGSGVDR